MNSLWWGYEIYTHVWNFELGGWEEICNAGDTLAFTNLDDLWPEFWETWDHELDEARDEYPDAIVLQEACIYVYWNAATIYAPTHLPTYPPTHLPTNRLTIPTYIPTYRPPHLLVYLATYLPHTDRTPTRAHVHAHVYARQGSCS